MASRFWVGGSGNWSDNTNHWSASSGGAPGASKPTSADNVFFNASSFSPASATVTLNESANCLDMDWTGATNSPVLSFSNDMNIYGSMTLISSMTVNQGTSSIFFRATATGKTITTAGVILGGSFGSVHFYNAGVGGGGWTLQDNVSMTSGSQFKISDGALITNNKNISCGTFIIGNSTICSATLGTSTVTLTAGGSNSTFIGDTVGVTFSAASSTFICNTSSGQSDTTFKGGGLTFGTVRFSSNTMTLQGNSTFGTLIVDPGKTLLIAAGSNQTVTTLTLVDGSTTITLASSSNGSSYTITKSSGTVEARRVSIRDCHATGGATFNVRGGTNVSGNTGWNFLPYIQSGLAPQGSIVQLVSPQGSII